MHFSIRFAVTGALFAGSIHAANASSVDALNLLGNYNVITSGDATVNSHVDGNTLIGGNLSSHGDYHIHNTPTDLPALTVAGNLTGNANVNGPGLNVGGSVSGSITMNAGGNAYVGSVADSGWLQNNANGNGSTFVVGDIAGNVNTNGGNTIYGGNLTGYANANGGGSVQQQAVSAPFNPANAAANAIETLTAFSTQLTGIAANSAYSFLGNKVTFDAFGNSHGLAIFTINDANSFFNQAGEFQFNLASSVQTILFNVINSDIDALLNIHANFLGGSAPNLGKNMLWNFQNASKIDINAQFGGSLLALGADVKANQNIEGSLVSKTLIQEAEIHYQALNADADDFPVSQNTPISSTVPLPGTLPLLAIGLAGLGAVYRRNRQATA